MSLLDPSVTDGLAAQSHALIECLNLAGDGTTYQRYEYLGDTIAAEGVDQDFTDGDGSPLGGFTALGHEKGSISLKAVKITHKLPKPGYTLRCNFGNGEGQEYFRVTAQGRSRTRGQMKTGNPAVTKLVNPFPLECLSEAYGDMAIKSQAAGALAGSFTSALTAANIRSGGTLAWSLAATSSNDVPSWLSCNASTGALSGTAVAGTFDVLIVITETLANHRTRYGAGRLRLVIT
jgi:hypothetical protein